MLGKLLKYEFRSVGRILVPIGGGVLLLSAMASLLSAAEGVNPFLRDNHWYGVLSGLLVILVTIGILAVIFVSQFVNIQRFYRMLGQQGYLMLSLPVGAGSHMAAKLICACVCTVATTVLLGLCFLMFVAAAGVLAPYQLARLGSMISEIDASGVALVLYVLVLLMVSLAGSYLFYYLCIAVGSQWPQQRLAASILAYFIISFAVQVAAVLAVWGVGYLLVELEPAFLNLQYEGISLALNLFAAQTQNMLWVWPWLLGLLVLSLLITVAEWFLTRWLLTKRLNLG
ncbi:MAG: hypothetical protein Q4C60_10165 [Eubacteriales bacterium]|nr:hypothetical protein [Eubacteriales bacterium]